ncbi:MAG: hydantoinase B/oxoprolinase family protein [Proteobacteria bacterium]|nr:hydantoinase B/oxoprolinase family protein [Pseudomonadota bacterium]
MSRSGLGPVRLGIVWQRLNGLMDEVAQAFVRTSFSTVIRENWDLACALLDPRGRQVVQSSRSVPSFIGTMSRTLEAMLAAYPAETLKPGDVLITNDPWVSSGHLNDITMAKPIYRGDRPLGFVASTFHSVDIGGAPSPGARDTYEEGLWIPVRRIVRAGEENEDIVAVIRQNLRQPRETLGDIRAQFAAYDVAERRLMRILDEEGVDDFDAVVEEILERSEQSLRRAIARAPDGEYAGEIVADGVDHPLAIRARVRIAGSDIDIDFTGTSPQVARPINSVVNYTFSWCAFAIKCLFDPDVPNNEGSFRPIRIHVPEGSLLNPRPPAPVWARHLSGHYVPPVIFRALAPILPERAMAESASPIWTVYFKGAQAGGEPFVKMYFMSGGLGARSSLDGPDCRSFPSNISNSPVEVFENAVPVMIHEKTLIDDSGGPGRTRGGLGQRIEFESLSEGPIVMTIRHERVKNPPQGLLGGLAGSRGVNRLNGKDIPAMTQMALGKGDRLAFETPGGGGIGPPAERPRDLVKRDMELGYVSPEAARTVYGWGDAGD